MDRTNIQTSNHSQIILGIIFLVLGAFFAWLTYHDIQAGIASEKYSSTSGVVTSFNDGGGRRVPTFAFSYKVQGTTYTNYLDSYPLPSVPTRKFTVGESVNVFYDGAAPQHACLKRGLDEVRVAGLILVTACCLGGGFISISFGRTSSIGVD